MMTHDQALIPVKTIAFDETQPLEPVAEPFAEGSLPLALPGRIAIAGAAGKARRVLETPPPTVWWVGFGDNAVDFTIHCWINDPEEGVGNVRSEVLKHLWALFKEHGVELPYPQRDLNLKDSAALEKLVKALEAKRPETPQ